MTTLTPRKSWAAGREVRALGYLWPFLALERIGVWYLQMWHSSVSTAMGAIETLLVVTRVRHREPPGV